MTITIYRHISYMNVVFHLTVFPSLACGMHFRTSLCHMQIARITICISPFFHYCSKYMRNSAKGEGLSRTHCFDGVSPSWQRGYGRVPIMAARSKESIPLFSNSLLFPMSFHLALQPSGCHNQQSGRIFPP